MRSEAYFNNWYERTELLIGKDGIRKLNNAHVLIAGLGGVGGITAEMLCRAGIGSLTIADSDKYSVTNRNRQIGSFISTEGKFKTEITKERLLDINPDININTYNKYLKDNELANLLTLYSYDFVVDAIDTLSPKVFFIYHSIKNNLRLVSSMGAGGKTDPTQIKIADISESYECKFASDVRKKLHKLNIEKGFEVVFSSEKVPRNVIQREDNTPNKKSTVGTISYMPALFGLFCTSVVIRNLLKQS